ncbi:hypothetical protein IJ818_04065 [bacterium]|nr:hypothetical protein [bacterium]
MELTAITDFASQYSNFLNTAKKTTNQKNTAQNTNAEKSSDNNPASKIILTKKGSSGYIKGMDENDDGEVTLEEFNNYCEENGVSEKDKIAMLTSMTVSKKNEKIVEKNIKTEDKEKSRQEQAENDKAVYAKKGDDKYNEKMDTNRNGIVTYAEYVKYLSEQAKQQAAGTEETQNSKQETEQKDVQNTNADNDEQNDEHEILSTVMSTVEYEV